MILYLLKDGQQTGPYTNDQLRDMVSLGQAIDGDLAWHEGITDWTPLRQVLETNVDGDNPAVPPSMPQAGVPTGTPPPKWSRRRTVFVVVAVLGVVGAVFFAGLLFLTLYAIGKEAQKQGRASSPSITSTTPRAEAMPLNLETARAFTGLRGAPLVTALSEVFIDMGTRDMAEPKKPMEPRKITPVEGDIFAVRKMGFDYNLTIRKIAQNRETIKEHPFGSIFLGAHKRARMQADDLLKAGLIDDVTFDAIKNW